jgi:hypothetical protein
MTRLCASSTGELHRVRAPPALDAPPIARTGRSARRVSRSTTQQSTARPPELVHPKRVIRSPSMARTAVTGSASPSSTVGEGNGDRRATAGPPPPRRRHPPSWRREHPVAPGMWQPAPLLRAAPHHASGVRQGGLYCLPRYRARRCEGNRCSDGWCGRNLLRRRHSGSYSMVLSDASGVLVIYDA